MNTLPPLYGDGEHDDTAAIQARKSTPVQNATTTIADVRKWVDQHLAKPSILPVPVTKLTKREHIRAQIDDEIAWAKAQATWIADDSPDDTYSPRPALKIP